MEPTDPLTTTDFVWCASPAGGDAMRDRHVAFRGRFRLEAAEMVDLRVLASGWYLAFVDGVEIGEGPARFDAAAPEYSTFPLALDAGDHVLALHVHHAGVPTQHLQALDPFVWAEVHLGETRLPVAWRAQTLGGYEREVRRLNPNLGWIEWCDLREVPPAWLGIEFDDADWPEPPVAQPDLGQLRPLSSAVPGRWPVDEIALVGHGRFAERFGLLHEDPPTAFALRDLAPADVPADGSWFRFDLGRTRLGRAAVHVEVPAGTAVEIGYGESLVGGRVVPVMNWSNGLSCALDHYVTAGPHRPLGPMAPRGCRFVEVHVGSEVEPDQIELSFVERSYFGEPVGAFDCGEKRLGQIWRTSIDTLRACAEDAVTDCPTRERGQWIGDSTVVGLELASVAYPDLRLFRRALVQAAQCPDGRGFVAGNAPGMRFHLATYSAQWFTSCVRYVELTGDTSILHDLLAAARTNCRAFLDSLRPDGRLPDDVPWPFVDWGQPHGGASQNLAFHLHVLAGARSLQRWAAMIETGLSEADELGGSMTDTVSRWIGNDLDVDAIGYHATVLALRNGLIDDHAQVAVAAIERHLLSCFPNDRAAPRLGRPTSTEHRVITPYFAHFALSALVERGRTAFVLDQYRRCWGWFLDEGYTTWPEVFDHRWSHCHHWSGAPAWQMSRYVLGLHPRFDVAPSHYVLRVHGGGLESASGVLPMAGTDHVVSISWERDGGRLRYELVPTADITVDVGDSSLLVSAGERWRHIVDDEDDVAARGAR